MVVSYGGTYNPLIWIKQSKLVEKKIITNPKLKAQIL